MGGDMDDRTEMDDTLGGRKIRDGERSALDGVGPAHLTPLAALVLGTVPDKCSCGMYHITDAEADACPYATARP